MQIIAGALLALILFAVLAGLLTLCAYIIAALLIVAGVAEPAAIMFGMFFVLLLWFGVLK